MEKLTIDNAMIEITRRCNMTCEHCLRGDMQNKEISDAHIDEFFSRVSYIGNLTITGGEPSIAVHKINAIIDAAKRHGVDIGSFYIATNAKVVSDEFLIALIRLHCYCSDNEASAVNYSNDYYHDPMRDENIKRLSVFSFVSPKYSEDYMPEMGEYEINEGRAKENGIGIRDEKGISKRNFDRENYMYESTITSELEVYLNAKGNIIAGCDWSFKSQDRKSLIICKVGEMSVEAFEKYLDRFEKNA
jgi:hypothetical protein